VLWKKFSTNDHESDSYPGASEFVGEAREAWRKSDTRRKQAFRELYRSRQGRAPGSERPAGYLTETYGTDNKLQSRKPLDETGGLPERSRGVTISIPGRGKGSEKTLNSRIGGGRRDFRTREHTVLVEPWNAIWEKWKENLIRCTDKVVLTTRRQDRNALTLTWLFLIIQSVSVWAEAGSRKGLKRLRWCNLSVAGLLVLSLNGGNPDMLKGSGYATRCRDAWKSAWTSAPERSLRDGQIKKGKGARIGWLINRRSGPLWIVKTVDSRKWLDSGNWELN